MMSFYQFILLGLCLHVDDKKSPPPSGLLSFMPKVEINQEIYMIVDSNFLNLVSCETISFSNNFFVLLSFSSISLLAWIDNSIICDILKKLQG
jgi:hypothetical protein